MAYIDSPFNHSVADFRDTARRFDQSPYFAAEAGQSRISTLLDAHYHNLAIHLGVQHLFRTDAPCSQLYFTMLFAYFI